MNTLPRQQVSLEGLNTLAIPVTADYLVEITDPQQIPEWVEWAEAHQLPVLVLSGGSNVVLRDHLNALVLLMRSEGISQQTVDEQQVRVTVAAGVEWQRLVDWSLEQGLYGLENLTLIPGLVGAAPVQNIGAYGVELADTLHSVKGYDLQQREWRELSGDECQFGYRDSIFKRELRDAFVITEVTLTLSRNPQLTLDYGDLASQLADEIPTPQRVEQVIRAIRQQKLPDPQKIPNAGSFFKNPLVTLEHYETLKQSYPTLVAYLAGEQMKLAAGWLIDQAGWKGKASEGVAVHQQQALVLTNPGHASGEQVLALAMQIQQDIEQTFGVTLEIEPRLYPADERQRGN